MATLPSQAQPLRPVPALTGLRVLLIAYIVVFHMRALNLLKVPEVVDAYFELRSSMSLFFLLSGFVLAYHYAGRFEASLSGFWPYLWDRLCRILPLYLVSFIVVTPITLLLVEPIPPLVTAASWVANLFLLQAFVAHPWFHRWNVPAWYLSVLLVFYVAFPFFARVVLSRLHRPRAHLALLALLWLVIVVVSGGVLVWFLWRSPNSDFAAFDHRLYSPLIRLWEFFAGCVMGALVVQVHRQPAGRLARLLSRESVRNALLATALGGSAILAVAVVQTRSPGVVSWLTAPYAWFIPLFLVAVLALATGRTFAHQFLEHRGLLIFGDASYAVFLLHWLPFVALFELAKAGHPIPPWAPPLALAGVLLIAFPAHAYIEQPARRWLRRVGPWTASARHREPRLATAPVSPGDAPAR
ncbi:MAG: acyltransferase [Chloroflexi bacterium]|nr:acyltransferase [Chloroflexota bacterium]